MRYEIDQSGKIEDTTKDTIVAICNGGGYSLLIKARTKRLLQKGFRSVGKPRVFIYTVLGILIYLLIKRRSPIGIITIDNEYPGHMYAVRNIAYTKLMEDNFKNRFDIVIGNIGKKSRAHEYAISCYRKKMNADEVISYIEIKKMIGYFKVKPRAT